MLFTSSRTSAAPQKPLLLKQSRVPGIFAGTKIATRNAWEPIEQLKEGDLVLTAEHGEQVITSIEEIELDLSDYKPLSEQWPVLVPAGVIGNATQMVLAPDMHVVIEDETAGLLFGSTCVSIKASDLIGYRGVARARLAQPLTYFRLSFTHGVSLVAEGGVFFDMPSPRGARRFQTLDARQARLLVRNMGEETHSRRSRKVASGWI